MKVMIEMYRGFEITFDNVTETFSAFSDHFDTEFAKKSFASIKKGVDEYINANVKFKPFKVLGVSGYSGEISSINQDEEKTIVGIRKDGRLIYMDENGKKRQMSDYSVNDYVLASGITNEVLQDLEALDTSEQNFIAKIKKQRQQIISELNLIKLTDKIIELKKKFEL